MRKYEDAEKSRVLKCAAAFRGNWRLRTDMRSQKQKRFRSCSKFRELDSHGRQVLQYYGVRICLIEEGGRASKCYPFRKGQSTSIWDFTAS